MYFSLTGGPLQPEGRHSFAPSSQTCNGQHQVSVATSSQRVKTYKHTGATPEPCCIVPVHTAEQVVFPVRVCIPQAGKASHG